MSTGPWEGGKGSRPRKYSVKKYLDNYERIFNASKQEEGQEGDKRKHQDRDGSGEAQKQAIAIAMSRAKRKKPTYE
jgi:hypothetical protein